MKKVGVELRVRRPADTKTSANIGPPDEPGGAPHMQSLLDDVHAQFISAGRGRPEARPGSGRPLRRWAHRVGRPRRKT